MEITRQTSLAKSTDGRVSQSNKSAASSSRGYRAPDYVRCIKCGGSNILLTDAMVFCNDCEVGLPGNLSLCPKCCSCKTGAKSVIQAKKPGRAPIIMDTCADCGHKYNSHSCLRVPYVWVWSMIDRQEREQCQTNPQLEYGSHPTIEVIPKST